MKSFFYLSMLLLVITVISLNFGNESFGVEKINDYKTPKSQESNKDEIRDGISDTTASPLKQYKMGMPMNRIQCNDSHELVLGQLTRKPACVLPDTAIKLIDRGWAISKEEQSKLFSSLSDTQQKQNMRSDAELSITPKIINGEHFLIFEGMGWHNLHNVEITLFKEGKEITSVRSKTNENGVLYMPWPLPSNLQSGYYQIQATDGFHQSELTIPISGDPIKLQLTSSDLKVEVKGEKQVRRGTTHSIEVQVSRENYPVDGARVNITIEDYGEDIIREFKGYTNQQGYFVFSWEIPKSFDDIETLLAFVDVIDGASSKTNLFKFHVYCLPGEKNCKVDGN